MATPLQRKEPIYAYDGSYGVVFSGRGIYQWTGEKWHHTDFSLYAGNLIHLGGSRWIAKGAHLVYYIFNGTVKRMGDIPPGATITGKGHEIYALVNGTVLRWNEMANSWAETRFLGKDVLRMALVPDGIVEVRADGILYRSWAEMQPEMIEELRLRAIYGSWSLGWGALIHLSSDREPSLHFVGDDGSLTRYALEYDGGEFTVVHDEGTALFVAGGSVFTLKRDGTVTSTASDAESLPGVYNGRAVLYSVHRTARSVYLSLASTGNRPDGEEPEARPFIEPLSSTVTLISVAVAAAALLLYLLYHPPTGVLARAFDKVWKRRDKQELKARIVAEIYRNPGIHLTKLARVLGMSRSAVKHHLDYLQQKGDLLIRKHNSKLCYYHIDHRLITCVDPGARDVFKVICEEPGIHLSALARRVTRQKGYIQKATAQLSHAGLIFSERKGQWKVFYPTEKGLKVYAMIASTESGPLSAPPLSPITVPGARAS